MSSLFFELGPKFGSQKAQFEGRVEVESTLEYKDKVTKNGQSSFEFVIRSTHRNVNGTLSLCFLYLFLLTLSFSSL